jgi:hypothetical protein
LNVLADIPRGYFYALLAAGVATPKLPISRELESASNLHRYLGFRKTCDANRPVNSNDATVMLQNHSRGIF